MASSSVIDEAFEKVYDAVDDVKVYLASPEGQELRRKIAMGMIAAAPLIARAPFVRAHPIGRVIGFAGGAALIVKAAEMLRDWEPAPAAVVTPER